MPICPSCHREQAQASGFCVQCGALLDRPASASPQSSAFAKPEPALKAAPVSAHRQEFGDVGGYIVRRFLALVVDIVFVGALIAIALRAWITNAAGSESMTARGFFELVILTSVGLFVYRWLFDGVAGTTLGKQLFGLCVERRGGGSAGLVRAFIRTLVLPLDLAVVGLLLAAVTPERRRIGDFLAGTVVVNSRLGGLAPFVGALALGVAALADYSYAGGLGAAQRLAHDANQLAPVLINGASPPPVAPVTPPTSTSPVSPTTYR
jgi:uncharacterized RDD family membrane protein YckC